MFNLTKRYQDEKFLKHIEEEAENQLIIAGEKIRNEVFQFFFKTNKIFVMLRI